LDALEALGPFGPNNPEPLFVVQNIRITSQRIVGNAHRQLLLEQQGDPTRNRFPAVQFNIGPIHGRDSHSDNLIDRLVFRLRWNRWNNDKKIQLLVEDTEFG
jgi:single-stranded-DNA-specific exonuclease